MDETETEGEDSMAHVLGSSAVTATGVGSRRDPVAHTDRDYEMSQATAEQIAAAESTETVRAHRYDWDRFVSWCRDQGRLALPATPQTLAEYVLHLTRVRKPDGARYAPATVERALASVAAMHGKAGYRVDRVSALAVLRSYRKERDRDGFRVRRAAVVDVEKLRRMSQAADQARSPAARARDRMVLLLGFALFARRSELASVRVGDVEFHDEGMLVRLVRSKTDKEAKGEYLPVPVAGDPLLCAVEASRVWLAEMAAQGVAEGFLVRQVHSSGRILGSTQGKTVDRVVKLLAGRAGVDAEVSAHTLRRSPATLWARKGVPAAQIAAGGGWSVTSSTLHKYVDQSLSLVDHPLAGLGSGEDSGQ